MDTTERMSENELLKAIVEIDDDMEFRCKCGCDRYLDELTARRKSARAELERRDQDRRSAEIPEGWSVEGATPRAG